MSTIAILLMLIGIVAGGVRVKTYLHMVAVPLSFLMISGLALLWEYNPADKGNLSISIGIGYLCVTKAARTDYACNGQGIGSIAFLSA